MSSSEQNYFSVLAMRYPVAIKEAYTCRPKIFGTVCKMTSSKHEPPWLCVHNVYLLWNGVHIEEIGFTYKKRAKLEIVFVRSNYKNYLTRFPCDSLNDDLNSPLSPFLQEQTWSFSPSSGMGHAKSSVWSFLVQYVVEDTVAKTRRRTKNGRNIFQALNMVLCRIFPTE